MRLSYAIENEEQLKLLNPKVDEVIIACKELSRFSHLNLEEASQLIKIAKDSGFNVFFDFDVLSTESDFKFLTNEFLKLPFQFITAIRVQDLGIAEFIKSTTDLDLHLITETGNHNLIGLKAYESYFGKRVTRFVVSSELNYELLKSYSQELNTPLEALGFGRLLIFYTPRKLVSHYDRFEWINEQIEVSASSEESPHKGFPVLENKHGTFMYHIKELFLFDKMDLLIESGLFSVRVDLRHRDGKLLELFVNNIKLGLTGPELKKKIAPKSIRGYFLTNKSDVLFKKLKNYRIQRKDSHYLGEVIDASKDNYLAIELKGSADLKVGDEITIYNPDGKIKDVRIEILKDFSGNSLEEKKMGLVLTKYLSGVWVKAQLYQKSAQNF